MVKGPFQSVHISLGIYLNSLGSIQPLTRYLRTWLTNVPSQVERSNGAWGALPRGTTSRRTDKVLNPGLDLDPDPNSCIIPLDQLVATIYIHIHIHIHMHIHIHIHTHTYIYIYIYISKACQQMCICLTVSYIVFIRLISPLGAKAQFFFQFS